MIDDGDVAHTRYRGHACELAAAARGDLVIVLGGDGAVNEAVNGIMSRNGDGRAEGVDGVEGSPPPLMWSGAPLI